MKTMGPSLIQDRCKIAEIVTWSIERIWRSQFDVLFCHHDFNFCFQRKMFKLGGVIREIEFHRARIL